MAELRAVGALDRCSSFRSQLDLRSLSKIKIEKHLLYYLYQATLQTVEKNGDDPQLEDALRKCIKNYEYNKLAEKLNEEMDPYFESSIGKRLLKSRRNTIMKYLWHTDPEWMMKEVSKESLKLADRKMLGGLMNRLRNVRE
jgi:hypothetical protein